MLVLRVAQADVWTASVNGYWTNATTWGGGGTPGNNDDAVINSGVSVTVDVSTASLNSLTNNGTLMFMGWSTVVSATVVQVNGTITHAINADTIAPWAPDNRVHLVCSNLTVASGGFIYADGRGYQGGVGADGTAGSGPGASAGGRKGGAYGGAGGGGSIPYGSAAIPEDPGSGGNSASDGAYGGGAGGGAIKVVAVGAVTNNGTISANGSPGQNGSYSPGGSGGGIYIDCLTFGGTGIVTANGGNGGVATGGGGGGGRIAINYNAAAQSAFPRPQVSFLTSGGNAIVAGGMGTLWLADGASFLLPTLSDKFKNVRLSGFVNWSTPYLIVSNTSIGFEQPGFDLSVTNGNLLVTNNANLYVNAGPTNGITAYGARVSVTGDVIVTTNSWILPTCNGTNGGSVQFAMSNLTVALGGGFNANGRGFAGAYITNGFGPGGGLGDGVSGHRGAGGGYGGVGGRGGQTYAGGLEYGVSNAPTQPGSAGGGSAATETGGPGGGLIWIEASGQATINGLLTANGSVAGGGYSGGGSGGGIYVHCMSLGGSGSMTAVGGNGGNLGLGGGDGGGGRIAVVYDPVDQQTVNPKPTIQFTAAGAALSGNYPGDTGSLFLTDTNFFPYNTLVGAYKIFIPDFNAYTWPTLTVNNGWPRFPAGFVYNITSDLLIGSAGRLDVIYGGLQCGGGLTLTNGGALWVRAPATNNFPGMSYTLLVNVGSALCVASNSALYSVSEPFTGGSSLFRVNDLTVIPFGSINASGYGCSGATNINMKGFGLGAGGYTGSRGGGGGYGGRGATAGAEGGPTYGSSNAPVYPGSGGGIGTDINSPGSGGGLVRVEAKRAITVAGTIYANGNNGGNYAAGGSGGGIYLLCKRFGGAGSLQANAGSAGGTSSTRGGGGGRIAVWSAVSTWSGTTFVNGGGGSVVGEAGTVVLGQLPPSGTLISVR
jgi:hypothetical protein